MDDETLLLVAAAGAVAIALIKPLSAVGGTISGIGSTVTRPVNAVWDFTGDLFSEFKAWGDDDRWFT